MSEIETNLAASSWRNVKQGGGGCCSASKAAALLPTIPLRRGGGRAEGSVVNAPAEVDATPDSPPHLAQLAADRPPQTQSRAVVRQTTIQSYACKQSHSVIKCSTIQ